MEAQCTKRSYQITQRQADHSTGTHLRVHHDRKTSLPDASSHAEGFCRQPATSLQSPQLGTHVSTFTGSNRVAYVVSKI